MAGCNFDNVTLHETLGWRCWEYWDVENIGILEYWDIGILGYWDIGILGYWDIGMMMMMMVQ